MANEEHLKILKQGVEQWNKWRLENDDIWPMGYANLSGADLTGADLTGANLSFAHLSGADLRKADLSSAHLFSVFLDMADLRFANLGGADLREAQLEGANLRGADLYGANLSKAKLCYAVLADVDLQCAILTSADLTDADLSCADLVEADFTNATITGCRTYGASAWNVTLVGTAQHNLVITKEGEPVVTVDDLEVGQFIYLILNNTKIRNVINTITSKAVLILGRFADPQRKSVLDGLREGLRNFDLLPIVFDFDRPTDKDYTETVQTLAGMSMFVIADLTSPKSTPLELEATVKQFKIPYIPIIDISVDPRPFAMLVDSQKSFHWVLPTRNYESKEDLLDGENLKTYIIEPAFAKREQLREAKNQEPEAIRIPKKGDSR
jgi:hypothetical protein